MKIRSTPAPDKVRPVLLLAADVSRDTLHVFSRFDSGHHEVIAEDVIANRTEAVERALGEAAALAAEHGLCGVRVLCEASGGYERTLLAVARRAGHRDGARQFGAGRASSPRPSSSTPARPTARMRE